jgi:hypothetical protein
VHQAPRHPQAARLHLAHHAAGRLLLSCLPMARFCRPTAQPVNNDINLVRERTQDMLRYERFCPGSSFSKPPKTMSIGL